MTTKILLILSASLFSLLTAIAGNFVLSGNIGATPERIAFAYSALFAVVTIAVLSYGFAICAFRPNCRF